MKKRWIILAIYAVLVVALAVVVYLVPTVEGIFEGTYIAEYGSLEVSNEAEALIVRDETVYLSKKAGTVNRITEAGTLVKVKTTLVQLEGEGRDELTGNCEDALERLGENVKYSEGGTQRCGYVSYRLDGYEHDLSPETLGDITEDQLNEISNNDTVDMPDKKIAKGDPISKIISNGKWWMVFFVDTDLADRYVVDEAVTVTLGDSTVDATVYSVDAAGEKLKVVLQSKMYCEEYLTTRKADIEVVTSSADGVILKKESLITVNDQQGVIVKDKIGQNYFMPVHVLADNSKEVAVSEGLYTDENNEFVETIDNYDEILKEPSKEDIAAIKKDMKSSDTEDSADASGE